MTPESPLKPEFLAIIEGKELTQVPDDLFIPPDALEVLLDSFSGPLDLLLYLIRKQNIDILNIPMTSITKQYLQYIQLMGSKRLELAADYLLMAAMLAEIKSRMLLPIAPNDDDEEDEDPRMTLVRRLQAYEQMKQAAELIDRLPRQERDHFIIEVLPSHLETIKVHPEVELMELAQTMGSLLVKEQRFTSHEIAREILSVRERMNAVLLKLQEQTVLDFTCLYTEDEGRMGLVVSLLAVLELALQSLVVITQTQAFASIHLQAA